jgi:E3 ubiquitin-protein ligase Mdm2
LQPHLLIHTSSLFFYRAVIRKDVELSSPQIGLVPFGSVVKVVGRAFSEHPVDNCIERLKLAGNAGWISVRLNRPPPEDEMVVELVDVDGGFDPSSPGFYHLKELKTAQALQHARNGRNSPDLSSVDENDVSDEEMDHARDQASPRDRRTGGTDISDLRCVVCLTSERNATIVHGETGHVVCCLICARILKARGDNCPVCRMKIDVVIQHFYA